jgi:hypothetical protein
MNSEFKRKITLFFLLSGFLLLMSVGPKADTNVVQETDELGGSHVDSLPQVNNVPAIDDEDEDENNHVFVNDKIEKSSETVLEDKKDLSKK